MWFCILGEITNISFKHDTDSLLPYEIASIQISLQGVQSIFWILTTINQKQKFLNFLTCIVSDTQPLICWWLAQRINFYCIAVNLVATIVQEKMRDNRANRIVLTIDTLFGTKAIIANCSLLEKPELVLLQSRSSSWF